MEKNDVVTVVCSALGTQGEGIAKKDGVTLFVPGLLPGERADVRVLKVKGAVAYGKLAEVHTPAEVRVRPKCAVFGRCGGCQLQHLKYHTQLKFKTELVRETLRKIAGLRADVAPCERGEKDYGYRNKLQLPVGRQNGENVVGFYAERSHRIVPTQACPLHGEWAAALIAALLKFMEKCGLDGYDEETGTGQVRHIVVRELKKKYIVTLVVTVPELKGIDYLFFLLDDIFPEYSFWLNINTSRSNVIFGETFRLLKGEGFYACQDGGISYEVGPQTFVQVNDAVRAKLYDRALSFAEHGDTVIDCYAGGGLLTAKFAQKCKKAYGIEIVKEAHACAEKLRSENGLANMENLCGRVEDLLAGVLERERDALVVLDPPRAGVAREVLRLLMQRDVGRIVMISCDPATLARDLGILTGALAESETGELVKTEPPAGKYRIVTVEPFDMFPQTRHVETFAVLERK